MSYIANRMSLQTNRPYLTYVPQEFIKAGTELTMDYDPAFADAIEFGDVSGVDGRKKCLCGNKKCRQRVDCVDSLVFLTSGWGCFELDDSQFTSTVRVG
jgi:hypothetical protein